jgi:endonuclease/exonuclease/phosphatase family metal-dependent hydrolase
MREIVEGLRRFERLEQLRASRWFVEHRREIERLLSTPLVGGPEGAPPAPPSALRLVQWNIEKALRFDAIADALDRHPALAGADVVMLNEVDLGTARCGNRHVARELAERLGMYWAFAPAHIELTKGVGAERDAPGENEVGLQGNAILSRRPLGEPRVVPLPVCFEPYHYHEKRYGRRVGLVVRVETAGGPVTIAGAHLEVWNDPACRARQARALLSAIPRGDRALVAGDFNVSTFSRGTLARTLQSVRRLLGDVERVRAQLVDPSGYEPLFLELRRAGFRIDGWNTAEPTIVERLDNLEDASLLPGPLRTALERRLARHEGKLPMRLDWFAGRGLVPRDPRTVHGLGASDHDPITVEVVVSGQGSVVSQKSSLTTDH